MNYLISVLPLCKILFSLESLKIAFIITEKSHSDDCKCRKGGTQSLFRVGKFGRFMIYFLMKY